MTTLIHTLAVIGALCLAGSVAVVAVLWLAGRVDEPRSRDAWLADAAVAINEAAGNLANARWAADQAGLDVRAEVDAAVEAVERVGRMVQATREELAA